MIWGNYIKMDSIRENRTKEDIIAEIRALFSEDIEGQRCIVLVEGSDDVKFMDIVLEENVCCVEAIGGKHGLTDLITSDNPTLKKKEVIAVRDKDYVDIEELPNRVFTYDGCCLETMILLNPAVSEGFHRAYYNGDLNKECYLINAMRQLAPYSVLRKLNDLEGGSIPFKTIGFGNLVNEDILEIEDLFCRAGQSDRLASCKEMADQLLDRELWNITNGHDLYKYLGMISDIGGRNTLGERGVKVVLSSLYRKEDFKNTELYHKILEYQNINMLKFVDE